MPRYTVETREVWYVTYGILASSEEDASKAINGYFMGDDEVDGEMVEQEILEVVPFEGAKE
jgi:hypothetical protein